MLNFFCSTLSSQVLTSDTRCVTVFEDTGCNNPVGDITNGGNGACSNVNTGTNVQSFKCSPNSFCPDVIVGNLTDAATAKPATQSAESN